MKTKIIIICTIIALGLFTGCRPNVRWDYSTGYGNGYEHGIHDARLIFVNGNDAQTTFCTRFRESSDTINTIEDVFGKPCNNSNNISK